MTARNGALYLILTQIASRGLAFIGNQLLLRYLSPGHLGLAVQLETLSTSILYTSRESLRVALQRSPRNVHTKDKSLESAQSQSSVNSAYLVILLGCLLALLFGSWYFYEVSVEIYESQDFELAFRLYALATILELFSEPFFTVAQQFELFHVRARAETTASICRCVAACGTTIIMTRQGVEMSVLPYATGQVCYAICLLLVYAIAASRQSQIEHFSILPSRISSAELQGLHYYDLFPKQLLSLAATFYGQSVFKWLLTQGDVLVLSFLADLDDQGIFALASNYGGLASRLLFQPLEESSRNRFGRLLASESTTGPPATLDMKSQREEAERKNENTVQAINYLGSLLHGYMLLVTVPCISILPHALPLMLKLLVGSHSSWASSQSTALLAAYSYYIPLLAVNGVLDAFVVSVATKPQLAEQSLSMIIVSVLYLAAAYLGMSLLQLGAVGLVYANMFNMVLRIAYAFRFIRKWMALRSIEEQDAGRSKHSFRRFLADSNVPWTLLIVAFGTNYVLQGPSSAVVWSDQTIRGTPVSDLIRLIGGCLTIAVAVLSTQDGRRFIAEFAWPFMPTKVKEMFSRRQGAS